MRFPNDNKKDIEGMKAFGIKPKGYNKQIAEYSDIVIAFIPDGIESRGTMSTVEYAKKEKKLVKILD